MAAIPTPVTVGPASAPQNPTVTPSAPAQGTRIGGIPDWMAGLGVFGILFIIAETDAAPVADVLAWGIAVFYVMNSAKVLKFSSFNPNQGGA